MASPNTKKIKWGLEDPGDIQDFDSNDTIVDRNKGKLPPRGVVRLKMIKVQQRKNKNDEPSMNVMAAIDEAKGRKAAPWNGYVMFEWLNVTEQGAPFVKRFLRSLGVDWKTFQTNTRVDPMTDPPEIVAFGKVKVPGVNFWATIGPDTDRDGNERAGIVRFLEPKEDEDEDVEEEDEDDESDDLAVDMDDDDDDSESDDDDEEDEDEEEEDADEEEGDAEDELREELSTLKKAALIKRAIRAGADEDELPAKIADLRDLIVGLELEEDEDEDEDEDEEDEDDEDEDEDDLSPEALKAMSLTELKSRCKDNGRSAKEIKNAGKDKDALIEMIAEDENLPPF